MKRQEIIYIFFLFNFNTQERDEVFIVKSVDGHITLIFFFQQISNKIEKENFHKFYTADAFECI